MNEKFKNAKYQPLMREEMISLVEGKGARRPAIACGHWLHIDLLHEEDQPKVEKLLEEYPEDMQVFYLKKPCFFGEGKDKYTWCDVPGIDPRVGRTHSVGADEETVISWENFYKISEDVPDINEPTMYCYAPEEDGRYRMVWFQYGPFQKATDYRGLTNSLLDLYMEPEGMKAIAQKITRFFKAAIERGVKEANIDAICFGDDLGMQKGLFMSPEMFREFYFPYFKEICDCAHSYGLHVWFHSCGDCYDLIPQLIEAGIDVLHPIQKYAMDEKQVAENYGDKLAFWAGMDLQQVLPFGSKEDVINEVHHFIDTFYNNGKGRMIFTLNNRLQNNVPVENFITFIKEAYRYSEEVGKKQ